MFLSLLKILRNWCLMPKKNDFIIPSTLNSIKYHTNLDTISIFLYINSTLILQKRFYVRLIYKRYIPSKYQRYGHEGSALKNIEPSWINKLNSMLQAINLAFSWILVASSNFPSVFYATNLIFQNGKREMVCCWSLLEEHKELFPFYG